MQQRYVLTMMTLGLTILLGGSSAFATDKDAVIIGGGSIGLMNAYYLTEAGYSVTVIEQGDLAHDASFGNAGMLFGQIPPLSSRRDAFSAFGEWIKKRSQGGSSGTFSWTFRLDRHFWNWLRQFAANVIAPKVGAQKALDQLAARSLELHREIDNMLAQTTGQSFINHQGRIEIFRSAGKLAAAEAEAREQLIPYERLSAEELHSLDPTLTEAVQGGIQYLNTAQVDAHAYLLALAEHLRQRGVVFLVKHEVAGFDSEVDQATGKSRIRSINLVGRSPINVSDHTQVILATGAAINRLTEPLGIKTFVEPAEGYHIMIDRPASFPTIPFTLHDEHIYVVPMGQQLRILGHLGLNGFNDKFNPTVAEHLLSSFKKYYDIPATQPIPVLSQWKGRRPCTPDTLPIIDQLPQWDNLVLTVGHCTHGIGLGPVTGLLVSVWRGTRQTLSRA